MRKPPVSPSRMPVTTVCSSRALVVVGAVIQLAASGVTEFTPRNRLTGTQPLLAPGVKVKKPPLITGKNCEPG